VTRLAALVLVAALASVAPAQAQPRWERLPPTPALPATPNAGMAQVNGIGLFHAEYGAGPAVVLLHGGLANADYWRLQIPALAAHHRVVVLDSRGQGRSTRDARPFSYALMEADVLALMDVLNIPAAALVGWSDGGIVALRIAIDHPERVTALFAFGANADPSGVRPTGSSPVLAAYLARARREFAALSPTPSGFDDLRAAMARMWAAEPRFTPDQLHAIRAPTLIVGAEYDELIRRAHPAWIASQIPEAHALILAGVSHFAFLQDPDGFNAALLRFLSRH
jgi:pimeloyl-ACP methyl ester carboxylesterase